MIASGTIEQLSSQLQAREKLQLELQVAPQDEALYRLCRSMEGVIEVATEGELIRITCKKDVRPQLSKAIIEAGYSILHLHLRGFTLDDIYSRYFQKQEGNYDQNRTA